MNTVNFMKLESFNKNNKTIEFICDDAQSIIEKYKNNNRVLCLLIRHIY